MRFFKSASMTTLAAACLAGMAFAPSANADEIVELNRTHVLKLPRPAAAVLIGNPEIADVSVFSDDTLFVLGRGYGQTDLVILDSRGDVLLDTNVSVVDPNEGGRVTVISGNQRRESYSCQPYCRPAPRTGDDARFTNTYRSKIPAANSSGAVSTGAPTGAGPAQAGPNPVGAMPSQGELGPTGDQF